jgi:hypothetical protein
MRVYFLHSMHDFVDLGLQLVVSFAHFYEFAAEFKLFAVGRPIGLLDEQSVVQCEAGRWDRGVLGLK